MSVSELALLQAPRTVALNRAEPAQGASALAYDYPWQEPDLPIEQRVQLLLEKLTAEEKIAQLDAAQQPTGAVDRLGIPAFAGWNGVGHLEC